MICAETDFCGIFGKRYPGRISRIYLSYEVLETIARGRVRAD